MRVQTFEYKLAGMRKADSFIVYQRRDGRFDPVTRKGVLNWKGSNGKYGVHLSKALGAEDFEFPQEFVMLALNFMPSKGDTLGGGVVILG